MCAASTPGDLVHPLGSSRRITRKKKAHISLRPNPSSSTSLLKSKAKYLKKHNKTAYFITFLYISICFYIYICISQYISHISFKQGISEYISQTYGSISGARITTVHPARLQPQKELKAPQGRTQARWSLGETSTWKPLTWKPSPEALETIHIFKEEIIID